MTITSIARSLRPEVHRALRVSETQRAFHDRVLDGVRKFLEDHAVTGKMEAIAQIRGETIADLAIAGEAPAVAQARPTRRLAPGPTPADELPLSASY